MSKAQVDKFLIDLRRALGTLENLPMPTIAAIDGPALGGGLELALACHARVAAPGGQLGLPEVKRGFVPGAGGTQRLPRLVGVKKALAMITSGNPIPAEEAATAGLVDRLAEGAFPDAAVAFARANGIDGMMIDGPNARFGIAARGKAYATLRQAMRDAGISDAMARDLGLRLWKVGLAWPLDAEAARAFVNTCGCAATVAISAPVMAPIKKSEIFRIIREPSACRLLAVSGRIR